MAPEFKTRWAVPTKQSELHSFLPLGHEQPRIWGILSPPCARTYRPLSPTRRKIFASSYKRQPRGSSSPLQSLLSQRKQPQQSRSVNLQLPFARVLLHPSLSLVTTKPKSLPHSITFIYRLRNIPSRLSFSLFFFSPKPFARTNSLQLPSPIAVESTHSSSVKTSNTTRCVIACIPRDRQSDR